MSFSEWCVRNGDKTLTALASVALLLVSQADTLHLNPIAVAYVGLVPSIGAILHTVYFPNGPGQSGATQK